MPVASRPHGPLTRRRALAALTLFALPAALGARSAADGEPARPHWDYAADGPEHWADLDHRFLACRVGHQQSPIDLPRHAPLDPADHLAFAYGPLPAVALTDNGHTLQAAVPAAGGHHIVLDGRRYALTQFHFHTPSEHTVDGVGTVMELHLVHTDARGNLAVVAVLMETGPAPSAFTPLFAELPPPGGSHTTGPFDLRTLLPTDHAQFRYGGSLTTPPCTEGVAWTVLREPVRVTAREADRYRALFPHSNRPTQPRNGRPVLLAGG
ncbi:MULTISPECIES: carbonic anhydrase [unclassified Nocardia]|uniref:carbonic anhydrase n=1 Tax=unclassified Nocardia TaxID=2637762 RepID=UPI00278C22F1|nr:MULTISPECIES: carbonic anhydrase family protein [unclassified Nocardia]